MLDKRVKGIIAEGDPRRLRDESTDPYVRQFFHREAEVARPGPSDAMSQKANYFKLGLFVIGALAAGILVLVIIGTGRFFERRVIIETYFKESVQGLDIGSKLKYRGVTIGEVTRISFTYVYYQHDLPMPAAQALRAGRGAVAAAARRRPRGGRRHHEPENAQMEVEKGLRLRLAPQGITGTSYLEMDYVDPPPPVLPISGRRSNIYIPSAPSTVHGDRQRRAGHHGAAAQASTSRGTIANVNKLLITANDRVAASTPRR